MMRISKRLWLAAAGFALNRASDHQRGPAWRVARYTTDAEYDAALAKWENEVLGPEPLATPVFDYSGGKVWLRPEARTSTTLPGHVTWTTS